MTQPSKETASMKGDSREEDASKALDLEIFAFNDRRNWWSGEREGIRQADVTTFHLSQPSCRTQRPLWPAWSLLLAGPPSGTVAGLQATPLSETGFQGSAHPWELPPLTRRSHPKIFLSLLLQFFRAQVRHDPAPVWIPAAA